MAKNSDGEKAPEAPQRQRPTHAIIVLSEAGEGRPNPVYVATGNKQDGITAMHLRRGEFVPVPMGIVESLKNAKEPVQTQTLSPDGQMKSDYRMAPRESFTMIREIDAETYRNLSVVAKQRSLTEEEAYYGG
jgi:hypothetical protein